MITAKAEEARSHFEHVKTGERQYWKRKNGSPDWVMELCQHAHDSQLPNDHRYEMIVDAIDVLAEDEEESMPVPHMTSELLGWLSSRNDRYDYCDQALMNEVINDDFMRIVAAGYLIEANEVLDLVRSFLENMEEEA